MIFSIEEFHSVIEENDQICTLNCGDDFRGHKISISKQKPKNFLNFF